jgi:hypothetical protein
MMTRVAVRQVNPGKPASAGSPKHVIGEQGAGPAKRTARL